MGAASCKTCGTTIDFERGRPPPYCSMECAPARTQQHRRWFAKMEPGARKALQRRYNLMAQYGVTPEHLAEKLASQGGRCAICNSTEPGKQGWHLDHSHDFKRKDPLGHRGLLCGTCNVGIGMLKEDPAIFAAALAYLQKHQRLALVRGGA